MKLVLVYNFANDINLDFQSEFIFQVPENENEKAEEIITGWQRNFNISDKEPIIAILTRGKLSNKQKGEIIKTINETQLRVEKIFVFSLLSQEEEVADGRDIVVDGISQDNYWLYERNTEGTLIKELDVTIIIRNFVNFLSSSYGDYSQAFQNAENLMNYSLGSYSCYLGKEELKKRTRAIIASHSYGKYIFVDPEKLNEYILESLDNSAIKDFSISEIEDIETERINKFDDIAKIQKRVNDFLVDTQIIDETNHQFSVSIQPEDYKDFTKYLDGEKFHENFNKFHSDVRNMTHKSIDTTVDLDSRTESFCADFQRMISTYRTDHLLQVESNVVTEVKNKKNSFQRKKQDFVNKILEDAIHTEVETTNLEYLLAHLDIVTSGKSDYVEEFKSDELKHQYIEKIIRPYSQDIGGSFDFYSANKAIEKKLDDFQKEIKRNNKELREAVDDVRLRQSQLKKIISPTSKYSWIKSRFIKVTNLSIVLFLALIILIGSFFLYERLYIYCGAVVGISLAVFYLYSFISIKMCKKKINYLLDARENCYIRVKREVDEQYKQIFDVIKTKYIKDLLASYQRVLETERYQVLQLRRYFFYHFYQAISEMKVMVYGEDKSFFRENILSKEDMIWLIKDNLPNVTGSKNTAILQTYLSQFKEACKTVEENIFDELLPYQDIYLFDNDPFVHIFPTSDDEGNNKYQYTEIEDTHLFKSNEKINIDEIDRQDVVQGQVGDCYFMAVLAGLAKKAPKYIRNTVVFNERDKYYTVRFYDNDANEVYVNVDGRLYTEDGDEKLRYARFNEKQIDDHKMWVPIIEKAWAKVNGKSYENIIGSNNDRRDYTDYGLALTGNYLSFCEISKFESFKEFKSFLERIGYFKGKAVVTLGSLSKSSENSDSELVNFHAYTLSEISSDTQIDIHNPHGKNHFENKDFKFIKDNFSQLYYFELSENKSICPNDKLDIRKDVPDITESIEELFSKSSLKEAIRNLDFYDYFWNSSEKEVQKRRKIETISRKTGVLLSPKEVERIVKNVDLELSPDMTFFVVLPGNEDDTGGARGQIKVEIERCLGHNVSPQYIPNLAESEMTCIKIQSIKKS